MSDNYMVLLFLISDNCIHCKNLLSNMKKIKQHLNKKFRLVYITTSLNSVGKLKNNSLPIGLNDFCVGMVPTILLIEKEKWEEAMLKRPHKVSFGGYTSVLNFKLNEDGFLLRNNNGSLVKETNWRNFNDPYKIEEWIKENYPFIKDKNVKPNEDIIKNKHTYRKLMY